MFKKRKTEDNEIITPLSRKSNIIILNKDKTYTSIVKRHIPTVFQYKGKSHKLNPNEFYIGRKRNLIIYDSEGLNPITYKSNDLDENYQILLSSKVLKDWIGDIKNDFMLYLLILGAGLMMGGIIVATIGHIRLW